LRNDCLCLALFGLDRCLGFLAQPLAVIDDATLDKLRHREGLGPECDRLLALWNGDLVGLEYRLDLDSGQGIDLRLHGVEPRCEGPDTKGSLVKFLQERVLGFQEPTTDEFGICRLERLHLLLGDILGLALARDVRANATNYRRLAFVSRF